MYINENIHAQAAGRYTYVDSERYYVITDVDQIPPFFTSVFSSSDHWLFISSNGALTAGRVSPETALFPYECVDKVTDDYLNTGSKTVILASTKKGVRKWEPFNQEQNGMYRTQRNLYKSTLGNKICFEEINHCLNLSFKYSWELSDEFGFVRRCQIKNLSHEDIKLEVLDGLQNVLPAGTPRFTQTVSSNLVDAYKWTERQKDSELALFTLYSGITDRAEPCEALNANTAFSVGLDNPTILLSAQQISAFKRGQKVIDEQSKRGVRGGFFNVATLSLGKHADKSWLVVTNVELSQTKISELTQKISSPSLVEEINTSVETDSKALAAIMAASDGFQATAAEEFDVHHYANTCFNVMRGGMFQDQYNIHTNDFADTIKTFNAPLYEKYCSFIKSLPSVVDLFELKQCVNRTEDAQLIRLTNEYLPIYYGRRHGDPSRPWNQFSIKLKDEQNNPLLTYQGNWRDIFQNWEALSYNYPEFVESIIAKFVNASTAEGYNPYRITKEGIDWEVEEPDDPWSYIGYWGDHQIIYLQKLLEISLNFHPRRISKLLKSKTFCYANVPYKIKSFDQLVENAKDTVYYDNALAEEIEKRCERIGADGKMILVGNEQVYQVNLIEKLLVPLLAKLGNLVIDGGIWLNTQRPEWNDANNALVGQGLSMVTLNYMRRYITFLRDLLVDFDDQVELSTEVAIWLRKTLDVLGNTAPALNGQRVSDKFRFDVLKQLGTAASEYRNIVYDQQGFSGVDIVTTDSIVNLLKHSLTAIDHSISVSKDSSGMYHAYNLLLITNESASISQLYPMLEGQVAALSSGKLLPNEVINVVESLFASDIYREDQDTFMLYPDRLQSNFMDINCIDIEKAQVIESFKVMLAQDDKTIIAKDADNNLRFNSLMVNGNALSEKIDELKSRYTSLCEDKQAILDLYEETFDHKSFTGRSGGMFGFEGLGCIYWHMVSKLLLAIGENISWAQQDRVDRSEINQLCSLYYKVRKGIGFNKTPSEFGAFPTDPYSHTPKHAGAQQPGMTGQVKEELIARFIELGLTVSDGKISILPNLLRKQEFINAPRDFWYMDVNNDWQKIQMQPGQIAFTWCQVLFIYKLGQANSTQVQFADNTESKQHTLTLNEDEASSLFARDGRIQKVVVTIAQDALFIETD